MGINKFFEKISVSLCPAYLYPSPTYKKIVYIGF